MSHVFISYSRQNRDYARKLADHLLVSGFDVWIDDRIDYGEDWEFVIFDAIAGCAAFIILMSPSSYQSKWVRREVQYADKKNKPQFPILLEGEEFPRYGPTQFFDALDGSLPDKEFIDELAEAAPRKQLMGEDIVSHQPVESPVTSVEPEETSDNLPPDAKIVGEDPIAEEHNKVPEPVPLPVAVNSDPETISGVAQQIVPSLIQPPEQPLKEPQVPTNATSPSARKRNFVIIVFAGIAALALGGLVTLLSLNTNASMELSATQTGAFSISQTTTALAMNDSDGDGLDYDAEIAAGTDPSNRDTDGDRLNDYEEVFSYGTSPIQSDTDSDGLSDREELSIYFTNPFDSDSDMDGLEDGDEILTYSINPREPDSDGDGLRDGNDPDPGVSRDTGATAVPIAILAVDTPGNVTLNLTEIDPAECQNDISFERLLTPDGTSSSFRNFTAVDYDGIYNQDGLRLVQIPHAISARETGEFLIFLWDSTWGHTCYSGILVPYTVNSHDVAPGAAYIYETVNVRSSPCLQEDNIIFTQDTGLITVYETSSSSENCPPHEDGTQWYKLRYDYDYWVSSSAADLVFLMDGLF